MYLLCATIVRMNKALENVRKTVDVCDVAIVAALAKRAKVSAKIGALKKKEGLPALDAKRHAQLLASRVQAGTKKGLSPAFVRKLFKIIHDESVRIQKST